ncbi:ATP synthase F1 subunit epsilon [Buchnera aphidicola]|uniref:ATP synthase F1 subunit epsilon n=1 Tax=Buchnera aphidicola TaxID=9 RepID=UPI0020936E84|nr:ATP synthase F1 subunit epsilon [Buchnera aphidicola]USS94143.1 ATP synthase F1 subunit epsilon [Buchnera aphidicola (Sipha maydis)]
MFLTLNIVSLKKNLYYKNIKYVVLTGEKGNFSVYVQHAHLITFIKPGIINVVQSSNFSEKLYTSKGIVEVQPRLVNLISDYFFNITHLDKKKLLKKKKIIENKYNKINIERNLNIFRKYKDILKKIKILEKIKKNKN